MEPLREKKVRNKKYNLLMIVYHFPSIRNVRRRSYFAYIEFKKYFTHIKIISTINTRYAKEQYSIPESEIYFAPTFDYHNIRKILNNRDIKEGNFKIGKWIKFISRLCDSFPFNLLIGEGGIIYIIAAFFHGINQVKDKNITHLYSSFRPYSDHIIAYLLKRIYPKLYWIADFRDLHIDSIQKNVVFVHFQHWCNKLIIKKANVVTTVSHGLAVHLKRYNNNVYVLRNGIANIHGIQDEERISNKFKITYTGSMSKNKKDLHLFLRSISELITERKIDQENIVILHAGVNYEIWKTKIEEYGLKGAFNHKGIINFEDAISLQQNAHINLLLTFSSPELTGILTSKLYEYLAAGKPILAIVHGTKDKELESIIRSTKAGVVVYDKDNETNIVKDFILKFYLEWLNTGYVQPIVYPQSLKKFIWLNSMKVFMLKKVFHNNKLRKYTTID